MTRLTTTLNELKTHRPCSPSWLRGLEYANEHGIGLDEPVTFHQLHEVLGAEDLLWSTRVLAKRQRVFVGAKIAQQVSHLTDDKRVHECLEVCFRYAKGDATEDELLNAAAAARSAWSAARSASDAARHAAARHAAATARYAAASAAASAAAAAESATWSASRKTSYSASAQIVLKFCETGEMK